MFNKAIDFNSTGFNDAFYVNQNFETYNFLLRNIKVECAIEKKPHNSFCVIFVQQKFKRSQMETWEKEFKLENL